VLLLPLQIAATHTKVIQHKPRKFTMPDTTFYQDDSLLSYDEDEENFSDVVLDESSIRRISDSLKHSSTKQSLVLRGNQVSAEGAIVLAEGLKANSSVQTLSLEWNSVGVFDSGIEAIASVLEVNRSITALDLRNNSIRYSLSVSTLQTLIRQR
jgi:Leucine Rich repeat